MAVSEKAQRREHSRQLDVHRWSDYPEVKTWVNQFWDEHLAACFVKKSNKGRKPKKNNQRNVQSLVLGFVCELVRRP